MLRLQVFASLAMLALASVAAFFAWRYLQGKSPLDVARDLKDATPLGIPARAIDSGISAATGRDETLGGWFAELFDPATRAANAMLRTPPILPHANTTADYSTPPDYFLGAP